MEVSAVSETGRRKYVKRGSVFRFSPVSSAPLPQKERKPYTPSKFTIQGRLTAKILSLKVGEMFTVSFNTDASEVSSRLTIFRKRYPDLKITTRTLEEGVIGIWRIS